MARGAASLSDSSMIATASASSSSNELVDEDLVRLDLLLRGHAVALRAGAPRGCRPLDARDEMAQQLLGDVEAVLEPLDGLARRLEDDDEVRALALPGDRIGQPAAAPRAHLDDLAVGLGDAACGAVEDLLDAVIGGIRPQDQHEFIATHERVGSSQWDVPRSG